MLAHNRNGLLAPNVGQFKVAVTANDYETVAFHSGNRLRNRWARLIKALSDAGTHRNLTFFFEFKDGSKVHFGGVN
jgi:hypothetical protein